MIFDAHIVSLITQQEVVRHDRMMLKFTDVTPTPNTYTMTMHTVTGPQCSHRKSANIIPGI